MQHASFSLFKQNLWVRYLIRLHLLDPIHEESDPNMVIQQNLKFDTCYHSSPHSFSKFYILDAIIKNSDAHIKETNVRI